MCPIEVNANGSYVGQVGIGGGSVEGSDYRVLWSGDSVGIASIVTTNSVIEQKNLPHTGSSVMVKTDSGSLVTVRRV